MLMRSNADVSQDPGQPAVRDRVLIVTGRSDDRADDLVPLLTAQGCAVTVVSDETAAEGVAASYLLAILRVGPDTAAVAGRLRRWRERAPTTSVAVIGALGSVASAVEAMRAQALDYLEGPVSAAAIARLIRCARSTPEPRQAALLTSLQVLTPGLVHELRNPLSGVLAGGQMLARLLRGGGTACEYAEIIQEEAQQIERFLARLAEFGRLGARGVQLAEGVDLPGLLSRLLEVALPTCRSRGIRIVSSWDPRATAICGDPGRLTQACAEILQNAQDAMPDGGTVTVATRAVPGGPATADGWVEVECRDTGAGLTPEARQRAFEPFFSTRPRALGVGLSLAQAIAWAHGGMIRLDDADGQGCRAILRVPRVPGTGSSERPIDRGAQL
jgi:signal transduction histidine kinase